MNIVIYGGEEGKCSYCDAAKMFCEMENLTYTYIEVDREGLSKLAEETGKEMNTIPQVFVDGKYVGGYREFREFRKGHAELSIK